MPPSTSNHPQFYQFFREAGTSELPSSSMRDQGASKQYPTFETSSSGPPGLHPAEQMAEVARVPITSITPGLDQWLQPVMTRTIGDGTYIVLPSSIESLHSPWFEQFYYDAVMFLGRHDWTHQLFDKGIKTDLGDNGIGKTLAKGVRMLIGQPMFKLTLPQTFASKLDAGEVLVRHHSGVTLGKTSFRMQLSAWSTKNQGSTLVFLGFFHCPTTFFTKLIEQAHAQEYFIEEKKSESLFYLRPGRLLQPQKKKSRS